MVNISIKVIGSSELKVCVKILVVCGLFCVGIGLLNYLKSRLVKLFIINVFVRLLVLINKVLKILI